MIESILLAKKMQEFKDFYIRVDKERFIKEAEEHRPLIYAYMEKAKSDNMIKAMLPVLTSMSNDGKDPGFTIAIIAYLLETPK